jgi:hypothetical protein
MTYMEHKRQKTWKSISNTKEAQAAPGPRASILFTLPVLAGHSAVMGTLTAQPMVVSRHAVGDAHGFLLN